MTGDIRVPSGYKHLLTKEKQTTEDYKAQIRHYIEARPGQALTVHDFNALLGRTSSMAHIKKLMRQGHITRKQMKGARGKRFNYKWHETPLDYKQAAIKNGDVVVTNLNLPEFNIPLDELKDLLLEFLDDCPLDDIQGAVHFRKFLINKSEEVSQERKRLINGHNDNSTNSA